MFMIPTWAIQKSVETLNNASSSIIMQQNSE